jgi:hypothetical protein
VPSAVALAVAVVRVPVRADRAEPRFQGFECDNAGHAPALFFCLRYFFCLLFFCTFFDRTARHARCCGSSIKADQNDDRVLDYCGKTA